MKHKCYFLYSVKALRILLVTVAPGHFTHEAEPTIMNEKKQGRRQLHLNSLEWKKISVACWESNHDSLDIILVALLL